MIMFLQSLYAHQTRSDIDLNLYYSYAGVPSSLKGLQLICSNVTIIILASTYVHHEYRYIQAWSLLSDAIAY